MKYEDALSAILWHEGGYYNGKDTRDPNPTNKGVTQIYKLILDNGQIVALLIALILNFIWYMLFGD